MESTVDVLMLTQLNQILKDNHIEYSLHTVGGCSCCGLKLCCHGQTYDQKALLDIINKYLATKWLIASYQINDPTILYIDSKFNRKEK